MYSNEMLNELFCQDAEEVAFEFPDGKFMRGVYLEPGKTNTHDVCVLRSVKSIGRNRYLFTMDFDEESSVRREASVKEAATRAAIGLENYFGVNTMVKDTAHKGWHVYAKLAFHWGWSDDKCRDYMEGMAYTIWALMDLKKFGVDIGRNKNPPYLDIAMYDEARLVRLFSAHPKSGKSPYVYRGEFLDNYQRPAVMPLVHSRAEGIRKERDVNTEILDQPSDPAPPLTFEDPIYARLPDILKSLVLCRGDPNHDLKWGLVCWLCAHTTMTDKEIGDWVWKHCRWQDLNNKAKTQYHVTWTSKWCRKIFDQDGSWPVPGWIYQRKNP